jgi:hypothetical protein
MYILHFICFHYNNHKKSLSLWVQAHYNELKALAEPYIHAIFVLTINIYGTPIWLTYLFWSFGMVHEAFSIGEKCVVSRNACDYLIASSDHIVIFNVKTFPKLRHVKN